MSGKYRSSKKFKDYQKEYYPKWYSRNGRNRAVDYTEAIKEWMKNNPEKVKAHGILNYAVKKGEIEKSKNCSECKIEKRLSAHHEDYSKPLVVIWLCSSCHKLRHQQTLT